MASRGASVPKRAWLAIALAYALTLQALFAAGLGAQHAAAAIGSSDPAVICFGMGAASGDSSDDGTRLHPLPCVTCGFAAAAALAPEPAGVARSSAAVRIAFRPARPQALDPAQRRSPKLAQGPPTTT